MCVWFSVGEGLQTYHWCNPFFFLDQPKGHRGAAFFGEPSSQASLDVRMKLKMDLKP